MFLRLKKIENYKNGNYSELQFDKKATSKQLHEIILYIRKPKDCIC